MTTLRVTVLVIAVAILVGGAPGARAQTWALGDTLTVIQKPLLNLPSIVLPGGTLEINCDADPGTTGWTASLERGAFDIALTLQSASYDPETLWWTLNALVPEVPVHDLYDLRVTADGELDDVTRHAVKVQPAFPDDFYFVHITDTHLPTYLYYYQNGADTDSSTTVALREIIRDVNIINPAFVAITGDFINEGELEEFLGKRYFSRAQQQLGEFEVPVFLTAGNHDIGGWNDTPPPDGTARRNWWRFFGWKRLDNPPLGAPLRTQNYSFDYGPVHFAALEAYDNYDSWRYEFYGAESFTSPQLQWLQDDLAGTDRSTKVLLQHHDFAHQLNLPALDLDMSLSGHVHHDEEDFSFPYDVLTDNAGGTNRPFRLVRFSGGQLSTQPSLEAGSGSQMLSVYYQPANDGTHDQVTAAINNNYSQEFECGLLKVVMPAGAASFTVTGGTLNQVDRTGDHAICYVDVAIAAGTVSTVTVTAESAPSPVSELPGGPRLLGAHPNPFNPRTEIAFELDRSALCRLTVFDVRGREVAVLAEDTLSVGRHAFTWQGCDGEGFPQPSGIYFAALRAGDYFETRKLTLVR